MGVFSSLFDGIVAAVSPVAGVKRARARKAMRSFNSYTAAKNTEIYRNFNASAGSANSDLEMSIDTLRRRSRHAYRNYPSAKSAIDTRTGIVISTGIDVEPNTGSVNNDKRLREAYRMWEAEADASGQCDFKELQRQGYRAEDLNGSALFQIVTLTDPNRLIPIALRALEADQLSIDPVATIDKGNTFSNGVESNKYGEAQWYHIIDHPGDANNSFQNFTQRGMVTNGVRVPAADIIHVFEQLRPGQSVGEPALVASLQRMVQEEELIEAELESAKMGSAFAVAITSESNVAGAFSIDEDKDQENVDAAGNEMTQLTSGAIAQLNPGEDIKVVANTRPSQQISPFREMLRGDIAAAIALCRTDLDKDYSKANYSSMRAAQLDKKRLLIPEQRRFGRSLVSRIYLRILPLLAVKVGMVLAKPGSMQRKRQENHELVYPGWGYLDPQKEVAASLEAIKGGLSNYQIELGARGQDYVEVHKQLEKELQTPLVQDLVQLFLAQNLGGAGGTTATGTGADGDTENTADENAEPANDDTEAETENENEGQDAA